MKRTLQGVLVGATMMSLAARANAQTGDPPQFTGARVTEEGAIKLSWQSETNTVYEIQYATELRDASLGETVWLPLYSDYPSHGTNTWVGDYGSFLQLPEVPHPAKSPCRFYRIMSIGTNTASAPMVSISTPTNGGSAAGMLTVSIDASSDQIITERKLHVDGQEMKPSVNGSNWVINTCEWPNGPHTFFATVKSQSALEGIPNDLSVTYGRAVSAYVNVMFDNLISKFYFSERFFEPSLGQTQKVSAVFAANVDWTLQIQNVNSNTVRTVTGSGGSMVYDWDGTGQGETNLPAGVYTYLLTAQTNGQALSLQDPSGGDVAAAASAPATMGGWYPTSRKQALAAGWDFYCLEAAPMPSVRTNGVWMDWEDVYGARPLTKVEIPLGTASRTASGQTQDYSGPASESTRGPNRAPNIPVRDPVGTFGVGWQTYPRGYTTSRIPSGYSFPPSLVYVKTDGGYTTEDLGPLTDGTVLANYFIHAMSQAGWAGRILISDERFTPDDLLTNRFNSVNVGLLLLHSSYADTAEAGPNNWLHIYLRFLSPQRQESLVKFDQCSFGGSGTNGLKWMALACCSALRTNNFDDMRQYSKLPINNDLHLLLGASTLMTAAPNLGSLWASNMLHGVQVQQSWYNAGHEAYGNNNETNHVRIVFNAAGWPNCFDDTISDTAKTPDTGGGQPDIGLRGEEVFNNP